MPAPRLNSVSLFRALDEVRRKRGLSWHQLALKAGVAASTMKRTQLGGPMEADGVLAMVRMLGAAPEAFADGLSLRRPVAPLKPGRFNTQGLFAALDAERRRRELSWAEAARDLGAGSPGTLRRLARGGRIDADLMLACTWWLGRDVNDFVDPGFEHPDEAHRRGAD